MPDKDDVREIRMLSCEELVHEISEELRHLDGCALSKIANAVLVDDVVYAGDSMFELSHV